MYRYFIRPLLFIFPPETIHRMVVSCVKMILLIPGMRSLFRKLFFIISKNKIIEFAGLKFVSHVGLAAGFDKNADFYNEFSNLGFSFIEIGTVTPLPQPGNPEPRRSRSPGSTVPGPGPDAGSGPLSGNRRGCRDSGAGCLSFPESRPGPGARAPGDFRWTPA